MILPVSKDFKGNEGRDETILWQVVEKTTKGLSHPTCVRLKVTSTQHMKGDVCRICYVIF